MRIAIIGTGYVGLVSGACFSEFGVDVTCVDKDRKKIDALNRTKIPIYEPGLEALVGKNVKSGRLKFTTNLNDAVSESDAVFIAVGTPGRRGDGHADLSYVFEAAKEISLALTGYTVIVTKSTVPVGTGKEVYNAISKNCRSTNFDVVSNPEFLREGSAIDDFMRPDRVIIGSTSDRAKEIMRELYRPLYLIETPILFTTLQSAEMIKYAANTFLATKITFINEIADLCEKLNADVQDVAKGIGLDGRINRKFLHAGPGYGGSCFPKDTIALARTAQEVDSPLRIVETVIEINNLRKKSMAQRIIDTLGGNINGKVIGILGLTFKPNTDDMRDSPSLDIIPNLQSHGALIQAYDPEGMTEAAKLLNNIKWCKDAYETMIDADGLVIITEWNQFRALQLDRLKELMKKPIMIDLRNIYDPKEMAAEKIIYSSIGRAQ